MDHWVAAFPRDFAHKEFLDKFNEICHIVGQLNIVSKRAKSLPGQTERRPSDPQNTALESTKACVQIAN